MTQEVRPPEDPAADARRQTMLAELASTFDLDEGERGAVVARAVTAVQSGLPCDAAVAAQWDAERDDHVERASTPATDGTTWTARPSAVTTRWIVQHGEPIVCGDIRDDRFSANAGLEEAGCRAYAGVPIVLDGRPIGALYALFRQPVSLADQDIDFLHDVARLVCLAIARGRLVDNLRTANSRLEEAGLELRSILDATSDGMFLLDRESRVTFVNPAAARLLGYSDSELRGEPIHDAIHGRHADGTPYPASKCPVLEAMRTGVVVSRDDEVFWHKDGRAIEVEWTASPIAGAGHVVLTFRDVAEHRAMDRMKDEFVSVASHELRTPLTSIRGSLGLLAGGVFGTLPEGAVDMVDTALRNAERLGRLVNDLLDLDRMRAGRVRLDLSPHDLSDLARQAIDAVRVTADARDVRIVHDGLPVALRVDGDRIVRAITNLVANAVTFSPAGGTVRVETEVRDGEVLLRIVDEGPGIPHEEIEAIFERFHQVQTGAERRVGGTGLGLAITRQIAALHGGRVWAASEGRGSTFTLALPFVDVEGSR